MAAISRANINLCGSHCGVSIGEDGPSQMALEDIAMFRAVHGSEVFYPSDAISTERLTEHMARRAGINYLRTSRPKMPILYSKDEKFPVPGFKVLRQSAQDKATVIGAGVTLHEALKAADQLKSQGIAIRVIDLYCVKPLDGKAIAEQINANRRPPDYRRRSLARRWPGRSRPHRARGSGRLAVKIQTNRRHPHAAFRKARRADRSLRHFRQAHSRSRQGHFVTADASQ